jgi:hypothetical protein
MKKMLTALLAAAVAGALFIASPLGAAPKGTEDYNKSELRATATDCEDGNSLTLVGPEKLWPPNHKYYDGDLYVLAVGDEDEDIALTTTGTHNQYDADTGAEMNGSGNTADDITTNDADADPTPNSTEAQPAALENGVGEVQTDWLVRAERSGRVKEGREYTLSGSATFEDGDTCNVSYTFLVPHDMRISNRQS